jgi:outer membrane protein TolC
MGKRLINFQVIVMRKIFSVIILIFCFQFLLLAQDNRTLVFEDAMEIARENSPDYIQARLNLERQQELLKAQEASLKSKFNLTLEPIYYSRERTFQTLFGWNTTEIKSSSGVLSISQPILWTDGTIALQNEFGWRDSFSDFQQDRTKTFSNNLYLSFNQPLFTYNRTKLALEEVELDLENAYLNYRIQGLLLEQRVAQYFYTAFQNKLRVQVAEEEYNNTQTSYGIIKNKVDAGLAAKEELYQAELNLLSSKSQLQNSRVEQERSLDQLKQLLGISLSEEINILSDISLRRVEVNLDKALEHGQKSRLELKQKNIDINLAKGNLLRSSATNEFKGNINLSYGIIGNDENIKDIYQVPTKNQNVRLSIDVPIWDWGERESRMNAAEKSVKSSELNLEDEKKDIMINIRNAYRNLQNQVLQIDMAEQNVKIAQLTYDINLERYENGDLTSMDLNLFQTQLSEKKMDLVNSKINYKLALLDIKIQSLWDFEKMEPVMKELNNFEKE